MQIQSIIMIVIGLIFVSLGIVKNYEPLLLVPIGFGIVLGNISQSLGVYDEGSVMNYIYFGVRSGVFPPLIFLGIGAMTDFSTLIANPKLILLGAAAQFGIFATFIGANLLGFTILEAGAIGIIGGADIDLPLIEARGASRWSDCYCGVLLHGAGTHHTTAYHQALHVEE